MEESDVVENFFGVYLLYCKNPKFIGQTYIGYTVDPNRRIKQHNKGRKAGGAWRTSNRGPWSMVMIVHGFPNDIAALRFEWAWQHPERSRRLNHIPKKKPREKRYDYCLRILSEMLRVGPWNRLPLTVEKLPPLHMPIVHGSVVSKKLPKSTKNSSPEEMELLLLENCYDCNGIVDRNKLTCLNPKCTLVSHVVCLSRHYLTPGEYVPIEGKCPRCEGVFLWGDIIRKMKGCYGDTCIGLSSEAGDDFYSSDSE